MPDPLQRARETARRKQAQAGQNVVSSLAGLGGRSQKLPGWAQHPGGGFLHNVAGVGKAIAGVVPSFPDDHFRNQLSRAQGGLSYSTKGMSVHERTQVAQAAAYRKKKHAW